MSGEPEQEKPGLRRAVQALRYRDFRVFFIGALLSNIGTWAQGIAVPSVLYDLTGSATWVGVGAFAQMAPMALLGPLAGSLADRHARRNVLLVTQSAHAVIAIGFASMWWSGVREPAAYVALSVVSGLASGFNMPAWQAFVSELVPRRALLNAVTLNSTQFNAARAVGPALGGLLLALGPGWAFAFNGVSYLFVLVALMSIAARSLPVATFPRATILREFGDTIRYARAHAGIARAVSISLVLAFFGQPLIQLVKVFAEEVFAVGEVRFGLLAASHGLGAILAAPFIAGYGSAHARSKLAGIGLILYGSAVTTFGFVPYYGLGVVALMLVGVAHLLSASTLNTSIQLQVDEQTRGKVLSLYLMVFTAGMPVGAAVQGVLSDVIGPQVTVTTAGGLMLAVGSWMVVTGRLASLDHEADAAVAVDSQIASSTSASDTSQVVPSAQPS